MRWQNRASRQPENPLNHLFKFAEPALNSEDFLNKAHELRNASKRRHVMGVAARCHAEETFEIDCIGARFIEVLRHTKR